MARRVLGYGHRGPSAYEVAVSQGFVGGEVSWLESLEGPTGQQGDPGDPPIVFTGDDPPVVSKEGDLWYDPNGDPSKGPYLSAHEAQEDNPHHVTAAQLNLGNVANTAPADLPVSDVTQTALNAKADTDALGTAAAADVDDFATAAQGGTADSAVQPNDLGAVATSNEYADLTGIPDTFAPALHDHDDRYPLISEVDDAIGAVVASLGTAAATDATDYATASQGVLADSAVQPDAIADFETSTQLDDRDTANRDRVNHTGTQAMATVEGLTDALDAKADNAQAVPSGGLYGQVLVKQSGTDYDAEWQDPAGIVYPSLLLSPDGSFDRNGAVVPTVIGDVSVVEGQYGQSWRIPDGSALQHDNTGYVPQSAGTMLARMRVDSIPSLTGTIWGATNLRFQVNPSGSLRFWDGTAVSTLTPPIPLGRVFVLGATWSGTALRIFLDGVLMDTLVRTNNIPGPILSLGGLSTGQYVRGDYSGAVVIPSAIPPAEIARISNMPTAWTMDNTAVNMALANQPTAGSPLLSYFPANRAIATGGTTLRTAPGAATQAITTLAASTAVHDTGQRLTASSVSYAYIMTSVGGGFIAASALV